MSRLRLRSVSRATMTAAAVLGAAVVGIAVSPSGNASISAQSVEPLRAGGEFQEIEPARVYDSRFANQNQGQPGPLPMSASESDPTVDIEVVGRAGLPDFVDENPVDGQDDNVLAVAVNITVIQPTHIGFLRAYGTGATEGTTSVVNFFAGSVLPNTAILRPGDDGKISLRLVSPTAPGTSHIAVDITGWYSTSSYAERGDRTVAIDPIRAYDSDLPQFGGTTLRGRQQVAVPIRGVGQVPNNDQVVGVVANITGVNAFPGSVPTFISALPAPVPAGTDPGTSTVNLVAGQIRPNMAILPLDSNGAIHLFNLQGEVRMVVDVVAYLYRDHSAGTETTRNGRVVPLVAPFRTFDTREAQFGAQPLGPAQAEDFSFEAMVNSVNIDGEPVGPQSALIGNLTATGLQRQYSWAPAQTFLTAFPSPGTSTEVPLVSNINIGENDTVPNLALLPYGESSQGPYSIRFYNRAGYLDYLLDVYAVILQDD